MIGAKRSKKFRDDDFGNCYTTVVFDRAVLVFKLAGCLAVNAQELSIPGNPITALGRELLQLVESPTNNSYLKAFATSMKSGAMIVQVGRVNQNSIPAGQSDIVNLKPIDSVDELG